MSEMTPELARKLLDEHTERVPIWPEDASVCAACRWNSSGGSPWPCSVRQLAEVYLAEHAARVQIEARAMPDPSAGCSCVGHEIWHDGAMATEYQLEYDPACPVHSTHLYDPRTGEWILREER